MMYAVCVGGVGGGGACSCVRERARVNLCVRFTHSVLPLFSAGSLISSFVHSADPLTRQVLFVGEDNDRNASHFIGFQQALQLVSGLREPLLVRAVHHVQNT